MPGNGTFSLVDPETEKKVKPVLAAHVIKTSIENHCVFGTHRFNKFSFWSSLVRALVFLWNRLCVFKQKTSDNSFHLCVKAVETLLHS